MQTRQFCAYAGHRHLAGRHGMAKRATELCETARLFLLLGSALVDGNRGDVGHRRQHSNAPFEPLGRFRAARRKTELAGLSDRMAAFAASRIEDVLSKFLLLFVGCCHPVDLRRRLLRGGTGLGIGLDDDAIQERRQQQGTRYHR